MKKNFLKLKTGLGVFIGLFLLIAPANSLSISPSLVKIELKPGENKNQTISLFNNTNQTVIYYPFVENFAPDPKTNIPIFLGNKNQIGASSWFMLNPSPIELKSQEKKEIVLNIKAPLFVEPGGHYAAVLFSSSPVLSEGVATTNRLAVLFLITISGEIKEELQIFSFTKSKDNNSFILELENLGNVHLQPSGQIFINNRSGNPVEVFSLNELKQNILPQSRRVFITQLKEELAWGKYSVQAQIYFGQNKHITSQEIVFWNWPQNITSKILGGLVFIILFLSILLIARKKTSSI